MTEYIRLRIIELAEENLPGKDRMDKLVSELVDRFIAGVDKVTPLPEPAETVSDLALEAARPLLEAMARNWAQDVYDDVKAGAPKLLGKLTREDVGTMNFDITELEASAIAAEHGIDNSVPVELYADAQALLTQAQLIRSKVGKLVVLSGFRRRKVQEVIYADEITKLRKKRTKAAKEKIERILSTQHAKAQALDLMSPHHDRDYVLSVIRKLQKRGVLDLDQVIWYDLPGKRRTIHISHRRDGENRGMFFEAGPDGSAVAPPVYIKAEEE